MTENNEYSDIYLRLMALSQESLEGGHYETAYHALVAAMHYAQALSDEERLTKVKTVAKAQQDWIDTHAPEHRMSTRSGVKRQGQSLYDVLARQAAMQQLIAQHEHRQKLTQRLSWPSDTPERGCSLTLLEPVSAQCNKLFQPIFFFTRLGSTLLY